MTLNRPCLDCGTPTPNTRCPAHARQKNQLREQARGSRQQRGYNTDHDRARRQLAQVLPAPCGYCTTLITPTDKWVAAHRVDGHPEHGWMIAHPLCNEHAKPLPGRGGLKTS